MALVKLNTYSNISDSDLDNVMTCTDSLFTGHQKLSLTNIDTAPKGNIEEGSIIELNGDLFIAESEETVSNTDPHTSAIVADGQGYIFINAATGLAYYTATAPTWDADRQGWYGTSTYINYRYIEDHYIFIYNSGGSYLKKHYDYILSDQGNVAGRLSDGTPYYIKEISIYMGLGTSNATGAHGISNAYTNDKIFDVQARHDSSGSSTYLAGWQDNSNYRIYASNWDNTNLTIVRGVATQPSTFKCKIWYTD